MLEKLLDAGSLGGSISRLAHHQTTLPTSLGGLNFPFIVRIATPTFLGYWALITLAFVICFQQDNHLILLNATTHVETCTSPF
jgi:hypothetical protein